MNDHERRLASVVEGILESYRDHGNINHLEGSNLPARSEVSELLVPTAATLSVVNPTARVGDEYIMVGKWDPSMVLLLKDRWGIGKSADR